MSGKNKFSELVVKLEDRNYPIGIGYNLKTKFLELHDRFNNQNRPMAALVDQGIIESNPTFLSEFLEDVPYLKIASGESSKSISWLGKACDFLAENKIDRSGVLFAIGGGVTGDLSGFVAASYLRGIDLVQVPTTLLSMVDSSVGGKTGVNLNAGKNLVGAFHQPVEVIIDLSVLKTLPKREFSAGMAEVIKYGMLGNKGLYQNLQRMKDPLNPLSEDLPAIVRQCCEDKANVVQADERESCSIQGGRALLNLGHTFAHAIEAVSGYGQYLHGEAVSIGLVCATRLSKKMGYCANDSEEELLTLLGSYGLPICLRKELSSTNLMQAMANDKKVIMGKLRFVLMKKVGISFIESSVDSSDVYDVLGSVGAN